MIDVVGLHKRFAYRSVLRGVDLRVAPGECVALLGPNGAGKTTLIRILAGLLRPSDGSVTVAGHRLPEQASLARRQVGVLLHSPLLYAELSAEDNLHYYGHLYGLSDVKRRADGLLEQVGLSRWRRERAGTFSRGMQQRLAIARALLHSPPVLLLDEPHTGLDPDAVEKLDAKLRDLLGTGHTLLVASHDLERAAGLADRAAVLADGRVAAWLPCRGIDAGALRERYRAAVAGGTDVLG